MLYFRSKSTLNVEIMAKCKITVWYFILFTCVYALQNDTVWTKYRCSTSKLRFLTIQSIVLNLKSQDKFLQDDGHFQPIYTSFFLSNWSFQNYQITIAAVYGDVPENWRVSILLNMPMRRFALQQIRDSLSHVQLTNHEKKTVFY